MIEANVICDSISPQGNRLTTFKLKYPRFIHSEFMTHRALSRNASSSRAIPFAKQVQQVRDDATRAAPVFWGSEQKGMQTGAELSGNFNCLNGWWNSYSHLDGATIQDAWAEAARTAADIAEAMAEAGLHKSICNRVIEPYTHITVIASATDAGWMNFFGLRLDKDAEPTMRALAEAMWRVYGESKPRLLQSGEWHLPFIDLEEGDLGPIHNGDGAVGDLIKISVARCARVSYESFETGKRSTVEEDLKLYDRLVGAQPLHASPAEHQATPDESMRSYDNKERAWAHQEQWGNFVGWRQYRKMLPGEAVAPLPEGYK